MIETGKKHPKIMLEFFPNRIQITISCCIYFRTFFIRCSFKISTKWRMCFCYKGDRTKHCKIWNVFLNPWDNILFSITHEVLNTSRGVAASELRVFITRVHVTYQIHSLSLCNKGTCYFFLRTRISILYLLRHLRMDSCCYSGYLNDMCHMRRYFRQLGTVQVTKTKYFSLLTVVTLKTISRERLYDVSFLLTIVTLKIQET